MNKCEKSPKSNRKKRIFYNSPLNQSLANSTNTNSLLNFNEGIIKKILREINNSNIKGGVLNLDLSQADLFRNPLYIQEVYHIIDFIKKKSNDRNLLILVNGQDPDILFFGSIPSHFNVDQQSQEKRLVVKDKKGTKNEDDEDIENEDDDILPIKGTKDIKKDSNTIN